LCEYLALAVAALVTEIAVGWCPISRAQSIPIQPAGDFPAAMQCGYVSNSDGDDLQPSTLMAVSLSWHLAFSYVSNTFLSSDQWNAVGPVPFQC
jgi:hypothetical protein